MVRGAPPNRPREFHALCPPCNENVRRGAVPVVSGNALLADIQWRDYFTKHMAAILQPLALLPQMYAPCILGAEYGLCLPLTRVACRAALEHAHAQLFAHHSGRRR